MGIISLCITPTKDVGAHYTWEHITHGIHGSTLYMGAHYTRQNRVFFMLEGPEHECYQKVQGTFLLLASHLFGRLDERSTQTWLVFFFSFYSKILFLYSFIFPMDACR